MPDFSPKQSLKKAYAAQDKANKAGFKPFVSDSDPESQKNFDARSRVRVGDRGPTLTNRITGVNTNNASDGPSPHQANGNPSEPTPAEDHSVEP